MSRMTDVLGELAKLGAVPPPPPKPVEAPVPPPVAPAPVVEAKPPEPEVVLPPVEQAEAEAAIEALTAGFKETAAPVQEAKQSESVEEEEPEEAEEVEPEIDARLVVRQMRRAIGKMEAELDDLKEQLAALEESL